MDAGNAGTGLAGLERAPLFNDVAEAPDGGEAYWLTTSDGVRIRGAIWRGGDRGTVLLLPGRTEFIEKYGRVAGELIARGFSVAVIDWRGQGEGQRLLDDPNLGHVQNFPDYQFDLAAFRDMVIRADLPTPRYLLGHSMGGCIGLRALHEGLDVTAAAFTGPMWGIYIAPLLRPVASFLSLVSTPLGFDHRYAPGTEARNYCITNGFKGNILTGDRDAFDYMTRQMTEHPHLAIGGPSLRWLSQALNENAHQASLPSPPVPVLVLLGSKEKIVSAPTVRRLARRWANTRLVGMEGSNHEIMMETSEIRTRCFDEICAHFAANP